MRRLRSSASSRWARLARIDRGELGECAGSLAEAVGRRALGFGQGVQGGLARAPDPVGVKQPVALGGQVLLLGFRRSDGLDLARPGSRASPGAPRARRREASRAASRSRASRPAGRRRRNRLALVLRLREGVEELERRARVGQLLLRALSVDRHEPLAQPCERADRRRLVLDERPAPSVRA